MEHAEIGEVTKVFHRTVEVRIENPTENCEKCGIKSSCHSGGSNSAERFVVALDPFGIKVGQRVKIYLEPNKLIKASMIIFILPLLALLIGAISGSFFAKTNGYDDYLDIYAIIGGLSGIGISIISLKAYNKKLEKTNKYYPTVVEIGPKNNAVT